MCRRRVLTPIPGLGEQPCIVGNGRPDHTASLHAIKAINACAVDEPDGVYNQMNAEQLSKTVIQNTKRKGCFFDL